MKYRVVWESAWDSSGRSAGGTASRGDPVDTTESDPLPETAALRVLRDLQKDESTVRVFLRPVAPAPGTGSSRDPRRTV